MKFSFKNWRKESNAILVLITLILANGSIFSEQLITLLHEAPFTVSPKVDEWIIWTLKVITFVMSVISIFTKKKDDKID